MDLGSRHSTQITKHFAIDTEPVWTPDGQNLVFTSDRSGKAQIYQAPPRAAMRRGSPSRVSRTRGLQSATTARKLLWRKVTEMCIVLRFWTAQRARRSRYR
jgi:Periplasmic component of the Tol biopolymer transport system